jgi:hypothetical protein
LPVATEQFAAGGAGAGLRDQLVVFGVQHVSSCLTWSK